MIKIVAVIAMLSLTFASCKKLRNQFECECSNGFKEHYSNEYEYAKGSCEARSRDFTARAKVSVTCKLE